MLDMGMLRTVDDKTKHWKMIAELQHISKSYENPGTGASIPVLIDISLSVHKNESIAIIGPSGSGKSTLLNILGTLDQPDSGKLLLNDKSPNYIDDQELAIIRNQYIGFVFQMHHLLPQLSLFENLMLPSLPIKDKNLVHARAERAHALLAKVGLEKRLHHRPAQVSIGECQRTAVIRALINKPELILADEPTGSLDEENAIQLVQLLLDLKSEHEFSLVMVTHSSELASKMDKVFRLHSGILESIDKFKTMNI
jgi:lipoprotein-releasing system ATP-binding protein